ncbi:BMP family ABC transporter substrate-binding protein [Nocardioides sp. Y6]|uniref:BMP family ABC transporter substrate-binding protein n=1 Tax=Nocardioides malaquae TaxID=2773426 RepID=A0ABR9RWK7_9ACTN|nr:BMP family ABC transporter substrate-binding protein [Nocardioides malaquae]MBE7325934.1 BMP family ABC transporter substrate-binding protein [Nocardioides malaquae]
MRKAALGGVLAMSASLLVACGEAPEDNGGDTKAADSDFLPCIVSDEGGFNDKSFNELTFNGVKQAADELEVDFKQFESKAEEDYAPALENFVSAGCTAIVAVGFELAEATIASANENEDIDYILIDHNADTDFDGEVNADNVKPVLYDTAQAAFLAGYAAADYTKTGKVGTYGGDQFDTVTIFMDGFKQGVDHYNEVKDADVKVVGMNLFTGSFENDTNAVAKAQQVIDQDVDVIMPVGGPIYGGAMKVIGETDSDVALVGVDADLYESDPTTQEVVFVSVLKSLQQSTYEAVMAAGQGELDYSEYVGTLENGGVGISSFHNFEDKVSDTLPGELEELEQAIIDGDLKVDSYLAD